MKLNTKRNICLYAGPGAGKSTTCGGLYYKTKLLGYDSEMNREYVKDWVWEDRDIKTGDQTYFFAKQSRRERVYMEKGLDFIITDSPLILTHYYGLKYDPFEQAYNTSLNMLKNHHEYCKTKGYKTDHFFLERTKAYNPNGRLQGEDEARLIDTEIKNFLTDYGIKFTVIRADETAVDQILETLK